MPEKFNIIAHRGFSEISPENTIPSFDLALKNGFISIEFDVQLTKDNIPVVIHDENTKRTTGFEKFINETKLSDLEKLQAKNNFKFEKNDYKIPVLSQILSRYINKADLHLELKSDEDELSEIVLKELMKYGWLENLSKLYKKGGITISSFKLNQLTNIRKYNSKIRTAWLVDKITDENIKISQDQSINMICPKAEFSDGHQIDKAYEKNLKVRNWGVKNKDELIKAFTSGSSGTTVDWPTTAKSIIDDIEKNDE